MIVNGKLYPLPLLEPSISENGSGYLPIPTPNSTPRGAHKGRKVKGNTTISNTTGTSYGMTLQTYANLFPTPSVCGNHNRKGASETSGDGLATIVNRYPTPSANEDAAGTPNGKMQKMLGNCEVVRNSGTGTLNPEWVELLMGWCPGWTSLEPLDMIIFNQWSFKKAAENWFNNTWEDGVPRVSTGIKKRIDQLKVLGNGQVPQVKGE